MCIATIATANRLCPITDFGNQFIVLPNRLDNYNILMFASQDINSKNIDK